MGQQAAGGDGRRGATRCAPIVLLVLALAPFAGPGPGPAGAQEWSPPRTVFIPSTGHTVDGLFLDVWRARPDILGDPITEEFKQPGLEVADAGTPTPEATDE